MSLWTLLNNERGQSPFFGNFLKGLSEGIARGEEFRQQRERLKLQQQQLKLQERKSQLDFEEAERRSKREIAQDEARKKAAGMFEQPTAEQPPPETFVRPEAPEASTFRQEIMGPALKPFEIGTVSPSKQDRMIAAQIRMSGRIPAAAFKSSGIGGGTIPANIAEARYRMLIMAGVPHETALAEATKVREELFKASGFGGGMGRYGAQASSLAATGAANVAGASAKAREEEALKVRQSEPYLENLTEQETRRAAGQPLPSPVQEKQTIAEDNLKVLDSAIRSYDPSFTGPIDDLISRIKQRTVGTSSQETAFRQGIATIVNQIRHDRFGGALTPGEAAEAEKELVNPRLADKVVIDRLKFIRDRVQSQARTRGTLARQPRGRLGAQQPQGGGAPIGTIQTIGGKQFRKIGPNPTDWELIQSTVEGEY